MPTPSAAQKLNPLERISALDGLRGIAVIMVMLAHFVTATGMPGIVTHVASMGDLGVTGVDLFFVLSGFLITRILLKTTGSPGYFKGFFVNRSVRILPVYYLVVFGLFFLQLLIHFWPQKFGFVAGIAKGDVWVGWFASFLTNVKMCLALSWGSPGHFWTLAVEQQFYLVWPILVLMVPREKFPLFCWICIIGASVLRVITCVALGATHPDLTFFVCHTLTPYRVDCFAVGAIIASRELTGSGSFVPSAAVRRLILATGVLVVIAALAGYEVSGARWDGKDLGWVLPCFLYPFFAFFYGVVLESFSSGRWRNRFINSPLLALFGKYSYAMYLFHPFIRHGLLLVIPVSKYEGYVGGAYVASFLFIIAALAVSLFAGHMSWQYFERFWLKLKVRHN